MTVQAGAGGSGVFYITYIQGRFRIYCKAALCWGVGAKGEVGFEVDGSSFAAFMKSFMFMLRNVDYQGISLHHQLNLLIIHIPQHKHKTLHKSRKTAAINFKTDFPFGSHSPT